MSVNSIDWQAQDSHFFYNERSPKALEFKKNIGALPSLPAHIWLSTSGTTSQAKWVALSKKAFLVSAESVCQYLNISESDIILNSLPDFHVGGLSQYARAYVSGAQLFKDNESWDPILWCQKVKSQKVTVSSLVPTQVFDLVNKELSSPPSLRVVIVGGGALSPEVHQRAIDLNWPLVTSYGMTECCSQVATSCLSKLKSVEAPLQVLSHVNIKSEDGRLSLQSEALLSGYAFFKESGSLEFVDPKADNWFLTSDLGQVYFLSSGAKALKIKGRSDDLIKIKGELVNLADLNAKWLACSDLKDSWVCALPDQRGGFILSLVVTEGQLKMELKLTEALKKFHQLSMPYEKIQSIYYIDKIPRTSLGKVSLLDLYKIISK